MSTRGGGNFRANLLTKLGADGGDEALEKILLSNADIDILQLKAFLWRYNMADKYRLQVWQLLTSTTSGFMELKQIIEGHIREEACLLWRSLRVMRMCELNTTYPSPNDLVQMVLLSRSELKDNVNFLSKEVAPLVQIVHTMRMEAGFENWEQTFGLCRSALKIFILHFPIPVIDSVADQVKEMIEEMEAKINTKLKGMEFGKDSVYVYMRSGGAALLKNQRAIQRLWDKLLCGGEQILTLMRQFIIHYVEAVFVRCSRLLEESSIASMKEIPFDLVRPKDDEELRTVLRACESVRKMRLKMYGKEGRADGGNSGPLPNSRESSVAKKTDKNDRMRRSYGQEIDKSHPFVGDKAEHTAKAVEDEEDGRPRIRLGSNPVLIPNHGRRERSRELIQDNMSLRALPTAEEESRELMILPLLDEECPLYTSRYSMQK